MTTPSSPSGFLGLGLTDLIPIIISILAFIISVVALAKEFRRDHLSVPKLSISAPNGATFVTFTHYQEYNMVYAEVSVLNPRTSEIDVCEYTLEINGRSFVAAPYHIGKDFFYRLKDALPGSEVEHWVEPLHTNNLLDTKRIPSYGALKGFLCFYIEDEDYKITESTPATVKVRTSIKTHSAPVIVTPLDSKYKYDPYFS